MTTKLRITLSEDEIYRLLEEEEIFWNDQLFGSDIKIEIAKEEQEDLE